MFVDCVQHACYEEQCRHVGKNVTHSASYDAVKECTLLERCLKETLRLRPPLVTVMRNCRTPQVSATPRLPLLVLDIYPAQPHFFPFLHCAHSSVH